MGKEAKPQEEDESQIEQAYGRFKKKPIVFLALLFVAFIIGLGSFTGALAGIPANIAKVVNYIHPPALPTPTPVKLPPQGTQLYRQSVPNWGGLLAWSPDGKRIADNSTGGIIQTWDATTGQHSLLFSGFRNKTVTALVWSHDSTRLAATSSDGSIQIWLADSGAIAFHYSVADLLELAGKQGSNSQVHAIAWSPRDNQLAFVDDNGDAAVVSLGEEPLRPYDITVLKIYQGPIYGLAWSPDGKQLAVSGSAMDIWNMTLYPPQVVRAYPLTGGPLAWSPNGKYIAALAFLASSEAVWIWDITKKYIGATSSPQPGPPNPPQLMLGQALSLAWACDGNRIALGGFDAVTLWDVAANKQDFRFPDVVNVTSVAWSPDGTLIASGSGDTILIWRASDQKLCHASQ